MHEYKLKEKFLGHGIVFPGKGFTYLTYEIPQENMEFLYSIGHPAILRVKKRVKKVKTDDKPESAD